MANTHYIAKQPYLNFGRLIRHIMIQRTSAFRENLTATVLTLYLHSSSKRADPGINVSNKSKIRVHLLKLESGSPRELM